MTVEELRELLQKYPDDMRVVVECGEDAFEDIGFVEKLPILTDINNDLWLGSHKETSSEKADEIAVAIMAAN